MPTFSLPHRPAVLTVDLHPNVERSSTALGRQRLPRARGFGVQLSPVNFRRKSARPVSCYALFKWWLLLSQHPGCLCKFTSFYHLAILGDLNRRSGLFPFRLWSLSPTD